MFLGYIDNGERYLKFKIKKDSAREAWKKLEEVAEKVERLYDEYADNIQWIQLEDMNQNIICTLYDDVDDKLSAYDKQLKEEDDNAKLV